MEKWQIDWITENLPYLIKNTIGDSTLLAMLQAKNHINQEENDILVRTNLYHYLEKNPMTVFKAKSNLM